MTITTLLGLTGGTLTSIGFIPQIVKGIKTKKMNDVSLIQYIILTAGMCFWLAYGILLKEIPIILANSFAVISCITTISLKIKYTKSK